MHGARGGTPEGERNGNYRHGARTKEATELEKAYWGVGRQITLAILHKGLLYVLHEVDAYFELSTPSGRFGGLRFDRAFRSSARRHLLQVGRERRPRRTTVLFTARPALAAHIARISSISSSVNVSIPIKA